MKSKFIGKELSTQSPISHERVAPITNYHRGRNGKH
jgi:hypothetical protein